MAAADRDRLGFEETSDWIREAVGRLVPQPLARRAVTVSVALDRPRFVVGDSLAITIEFHNRLPVPVTLATPKRRLWGWAVDGEPAAGDERRYTRSAPTGFVFRAGERKHVTRHWNGRFRRVEGSSARWVDATPGEHEVTAFVATASNRPRAVETVVVEDR